jgi:hypothetical protein
MRGEALLYAMVVPHAAKDGKAYGGAWIAGSEHAGAVVLEIQREGQAAVTVRRWFDGGEATIVGDVLNTGGRKVRGVWVSEQAFAGGVAGDWILVYFENDGSVRFRPFNGENDVTDEPAESIQTWVESATTGGGVYGTKSEWDGKLPPKSEKATSILTPVGDLILWRGLAKIVERYGTMNELVAAVSNWRVGDVFEMSITGTVGGRHAYGTDVYTSDSYIPSAAVHAGVIENGDTKAVFIRLLAGVSKYEGSTRKGVTTRSFGKWKMSYEFLELGGSKKGVGA